MRKPKPNVVCPNAVLRCLAIIYALGFLVSGCGEASNQNITPVPGPQLTTSPLPSPTLNQPDMDVTKVALVQQRQTAVDAIATQYANGTPYVTTPLPFNPSQADPPPPLGLNYKCVDADRVFSYRSCWTGLHDNEYIFASAGAPKDDPTQGMVRVYTTTLDRSTVTPDQWYATPTKGGLVRITDAANFRLTLQAENGTHFLFDLPTRQWLPPAAPASTGPEFDATKEALETQRNNEQATAGAVVATMVSLGTPLPTPMPLPTLKAAATPVLGIFGCGEADKEFRYGNCWIGQYNNEYLFVAAGAPKSDPTLGLLRVITSTLDQRTQGPEQQYITPSHHGRILITSFVGERLTLQADNTLFTFDLPMRQWLPPPTSIPTSLPPSPISTAQVETPHHPAGAGIIWQEKWSPRCNRVMRVLNQWIESKPQQNLSIVVCAGSQPPRVNSQQGIVGILTQDISTGAVLSGPDFYQTPSQVGAVQVVDAVGERLTLASENGTHFLFDLTTRQWLPPPTSLPTLVEKNATKDAILMRGEYDYQTRVANGTPIVSTPLAINPSTPEITPVLGIHSGCMDASSTTATFDSCWTGKHDNEYIFADTMTRNSQPQQAILRVFTATLNMDGFGPLQQFLTSSPVGAVRIIQADDYKLTLEAESGTHFLFDLTTRQWLPPPTLPSTGRPTLPPAPQ